jgi:hypothetical protein
VALVSNAEFFCASLPSLPPKGGLVNRLVALGRPVSQREICFALGKTHDPRAAGHFEVNRRIAFAKRPETIERVDPARLPSSAGNFTPSPSQNWS